MDREDCMLLNLPWEDIIISKIMPKLSIKDCFSLLKASDTCERLVIAYFRKLTKITAEDVEGLSESDVALLATNASSVRELQFASVTLRDHIIDRFLANQKLENVDLSNTKMTVSALHNLIYCQNLKRLVLLKCPWITIECLYTIHHHCKKMVACLLDGATLLGFNTF